MDTRLGGYWIRTQRDTGGIDGHQGDVTDVGVLSNIQLGLIVSRGRSRHLQFNLMQTNDTGRQSGVDYLSGATFQGCCDEIVDGIGLRAVIGCTGDEVKWS